MTKLTVTEEIAERIRRSEGPIELVDSQGHTIGVVRRPPPETDIQRARERASKEGTRLTWAQEVFCNDCLDSITSTSTSRSTSTKIPVNMRNRTPTRVPAARRLLLAWQLTTHRTAELLVGYRR